MRGRALWIVDGDTFFLTTGDGRYHRVRLHGVDAPESKQSFGTAATQALIGKIGRRTVDVEVTDIDKYKRIVGKVYRGKRYINKEMIADGLAWHYVKYAPDDDDLAEAEREARERKLNIWQEPSKATSPWVFRRLKLPPAG